MEREQEEMDKRTMTNPTTGPIQCPRPEAKAKIQQPAGKMRPPTIDM